MIDLDGKKISHGESTIIPIFSVLTRYQEWFRHYHNINHLHFIVTLAHDFGLQLDLSQELAIVWHDAIYNPGCTGVNELQSAQVMIEDTQSFNLDAKEITRAEAIILDTRDHLIASNFCSGVVLDLDLAALGDTRTGGSDNFRIDGQNIRKEFSRYNDLQFYQGRLAFWTSLINRPYIYHTHLFRKEFEKEARERILDDMVTCQRRIEHS